jgi:hypothetical protein
VPLAGSLPHTQAPHRYWLDPRHEMAAYWIFTVYAIGAVILTRGQDAVWAIWAAPAYATAAVMLPRLRAGGARAASVAVITVAFAVGMPLLVLLAQNQLAAGMAVIDRSAALLVQHGTPYLASRQLSSWIAYNPYLPTMALFGLPSALGLQGAPGNPQVWLVLVSVAALAATFVAGAQHAVSRCYDCRRDVIRYTAFAAACPVLALNLAVTTTDAPVLALMLLSLALAARPGYTAAAAAALGLASSMKPTAWLAIPVIAAMLWTRDGMKAALKFAAIVLGFLAATTVPVIIANPQAMIDNTVLFPLGLTRQLTPADSFMPGDLLARTGAAGHALTVALLLAAGLAVAVSLVWRPPATPRAAAWRLAFGLALMFGLGPAERFGYFIYPLSIVGWLVLTRERAAWPETAGTHPPVPWRATRR